MTVPVLILHAEDDKIVPSYLAQRLYDNVSAQMGNVELIMYPGDLKLGHRYIYRAPGIEETMKTFESKTRLDL